MLHLNMNMLVAPRAHSHKWVLVAIVHTFERITQINDSKDLLSVKIAIMQSEISHIQQCIYVLIICAREQRKKGERPI